MIHFTPDGRTAAGRNEQEYDQSKVVKVMCLISHIVTVIKDIQGEQDARNISQRLRCHQPEHTFFHEELEQSKFCIAMYNFCNFLGMMPMLRAEGIGCFGTSRFQKGGWPSANIREPTKEKYNFNDFYHCINQHGTLLGRWMDNGLVFCVSTIHIPGRVIKRNRKWPRMAVLNKPHLQRTFETNGEKEIYIPTLINDYNRKMGGVDVADQ